jgi:hypothetical protein
MLQELKAVFGGDAVLLLELLPLQPPPPPPSPPHAVLPMLPPTQPLTPPQAVVHKVGLDTLLNLGGDATALHTFAAHNLAHSVMWFGTGDVSRFEGLVLDDVDRMFALESDFTQAFQVSPHNVSAATTIAPELARAMYDRGSLIYRHGLECAPNSSRGAPTHCHHWMSTLERELGLAKSGSKLAGFATLATMGMRTHYDHNDNIIMQVRGSKRWWYHPNAVVRRPTIGYKPGIYFASMMEKDKVRRAEFPPDGVWEPLGEAGWKTVDMHPGDVMFMPRGIWHKVELLGAQDGNVSAVAGAGAGSLHYNIQLATLALGDIAAFYLSSLIDVSRLSINTIASPPKPLHIIKPHSFFVDAINRGTYQYGIMFPFRSDGKLRYSVATMLVALLRQHLVGSVTPLHLRRAVAADSRMQSTMAKFTPVPHGDLSVMLSSAAPSSRKLRPTSGARAGAGVSASAGGYCTWGDLASHYLSACTYLNSDERLRAMALHPFDEEGRLKLETAVLISKLMIEFLVADVTVAHVHNRVRLHAPQFKSASLEQMIAFPPRCYDGCADLF